MPDKNKRRREEAREMTSKGLTSKERRADNQEEDH